MSGTQVLTAGPPTCSAEQTGVYNGFNWFNFNSNTLRVTIDLDVLNVDSSAALGTWYFKQQITWDDSIQGV